jgi:GntR family transcriptional regulator/MocR family aminotransferase
MIELAADETGLHLVGWLPEGVNDRALAQRAASAGVIAYPLSLFQQEPSARGAVLLGYAGVSAPEIRDGVRRLASACRSLLRSSR